MTVEGGRAVSLRRTSGATVRPCWRRRSVTSFEAVSAPLRRGWPRRLVSGPARCTGTLLTTTENFLRAAQRDGGANPWVRGRDLSHGTLATAWPRGAVLADESSPNALVSLIRTGWEMPARETAPGSGEGPA